MRPAAEQHRSGIDYLRAVTALLQRVRGADPTKGLYEAADLQWWWRTPRSTDNLPQLFGSTSSASRKLRSSQPIGAIESPPTQFSCRTQLLAPSLREVQGPIPHLESSGHTDLRLLRSLWPVNVVATEQPDGK